MNYVRLERRRVVRLRRMMWSIGLKKSGGATEVMAEKAVKCDQEDFTDKKEGVESLEN